MAEVDIEVVPRPVTNVTVDSSPRPSTSITIESTAPVSEVTLDATPRPQAAVTVSAEPVPVTEVTIEVVGGARGAQGPEGPPGPPGAGGQMVYIQSQPASVWLVPHPYNMYPSVDILNQSKQVVQGKVSYPSLNMVRIAFSAQFSGFALIYP